MKLPVRLSHWFCSQSRWPHVALRKPFTRVVALSLVVVNCACGAGSSDSPTSPSGGGSSGVVFPVGTWVGTLTRPGDPSIAATWVATRGPANSQAVSGTFAGPLTLVSGATTVIAQLDGYLGGSNTGSQGYQFNFNIRMTAGAAPAVPNCSILSDSPVTPTLNLREASTTITSTDFQISYLNCQGFVGSPTGRDFVREVGQLHLVRQ